VESVCLTPDFTKAFPLEGRKSLDTEVKSATIKQIRKLMMRNKSKEKKIERFLEGKIPLDNKEFELKDVILYLISKKLIDEIKVVVGYFYYYEDLFHLFELAEKNRVKMKIIMGNKTSKTTINLLKRKNEEPIPFSELLEKGSIQFKFPKKNSDLKIHSKYYILKKDKRIKYAFVGSCNFSRTGLEEEYETMVLAPEGTWKKLEKIFEE